MRELAAAPDTNPKWIVLDGDLDANWCARLRLSSVCEGRERGR